MPSNPPFLPESAPTVQGFSLIMKTLFFCILISVQSVLSAGQIELEKDIFLGVWSPFASKWETKTPLCVWTQDTETSFRITASGSNSSSVFVLNSGDGAAGEEVRYEVSWRASPGRGRREKLSAGLSSKGTYPYSNDVQCGGGFNGEITVRLVKKDIDRASPGIYNDALLLMLSPI